MKIAELLLLQVYAFTLKMYSFIDKNDQPK